jgi:hypothetical protein
MSVARASSRCRIGLAISCLSCLPAAWKYRLYDRVWQRILYTNIGPQLQEKISGLYLEGCAPDCTRLTPPITHGSRPQLHVDNFSSAGLVHSRAGQVSSVKSGIHGVTKRGSTHARSHAIRWAVQVIPSPPGMRRADDQGCIAHRYCHMAIWPHLHCAESPNCPSVWWQHCYRGIAWTSFAS